MIRHPTSDCLESLDRERGWPRTRKHGNSLEHEEDDSLLFIILSTETLISDETGNGGSSFIQRVDGLGMTGPEYRTYDQCSSLKKKKNFKLDNESLFWTFRNNEFHKKF
jgi:hypothetical protein